MPQEINYKIGLDTEEARSQLMQMQSQITNTVNQSHRAVNQATPQDSTSIEHARRQQASMNLPSPHGEPFGVGNFKQRAQMEKLQGGYHYNPSFVGAGQAMMGLGSAPTGVPDYEWRQQNQEIFQQRTGDLAKRAGVMGGAGTLAGAAAYYGPELPGVRHASNAAGRGIGHAIKKIGSVAGAPLKSIPGMKTVGSAIGKKLPWMGSAATKGALTLGASIATYSGVAGGLSDIGTKRGFEQQLSHISPSFITSDKSTGISPGFDMSQRNEIAGFLNNMKENTDLSAGGISSLMRGGSNIGRFNGVETANQFKEEFSKLVNEVKTVTDKLRSTLGEGLSTIENLRSMGISGADQMGSTINKLQARGDVAGKTTRQMMNTFNQGAQAFGQMGMDMAAGGELFSSVNASVHNQIRSGAIGPAQLRQQGGAQGITRSIAGDLTQSVTQGSVGNLLISALGNDGFTGIDSGNMKDLISAGGNPAVARTMAHANLSTQNARSNFMANKKEAASDLLSSPLSPYLVGAMTQKTLSQNGIDPTRSNMELALRNQNVSNPEQFLDVAMNKDAALNVVSQRKRRAAQRGISKVRNKEFSGGTGGGLISSAYNNTVEAISSAGEKIGDKFAEWGNKIVESVGGPGNKIRYGEYDVPPITPDSIRRNAEDYKALAEGRGIGSRPKMMGEGNPAKTTDLIGGWGADLQSARESFIQSAAEYTPGLSGSSLRTGTEAAERESLKKIAASDHSYFAGIAKASLNNGDVRAARKDLVNADEIYHAAGRELDDERARILRHRGDKKISGAVDKAFNNFDGTIDKNSLNEITNRAAENFTGKGFFDNSKDMRALIAQEVFDRGQQNKKFSELVGMSGFSGVGGSRVSDVLKAQEGAVSKLEDMGFTSGQAKRFSDITGGSPAALNAFQEIMKKAGSKDQDVTKRQLKRQFLGSTEGISKEQFDKLYDMGFNIANSDNDVNTVGELASKIEKNSKLKKQLAKSGLGAQSLAVKGELDDIVRNTEGLKGKSIADFLNQGGDADKILSKINANPDKQLREAFSEQGLSNSWSKLMAVAAERETKDRGAESAMVNASASSTMQLQNVMDQIADMDDLANSLTRLSEVISEKVGN